LLYTVFLGLPYPFLLCDRIVSRRDSTAFLDCIEMYLQRQRIFYASPSSRLSSILTNGIFTVYPKRFSIFLTLSRSVRTILFSYFRLCGNYSKRKNVKLGSRLIGPPEEYLTFGSDPAVLSSPPFFAPYTVTCTLSQQICPSALTHSQYHVLCISPILYIILRKVT
jgi:hypothetical protein